MTQAPRWVYLVVSAAPPVLRISEFIGMLQQAHWNVCVISTPTAASWIDLDEIATATGCMTRVTARAPGEQDSLPRADAVVAAPLTFNTINKWAAGISDTLALGVLNEMLGADVPIIGAPCVKPILRKHPAYAESAQRLIMTGATMLDPDAVIIRADDGLATFAWPLIMSTLREVIPSHMDSY